LIINSEPKIVVGITQRIDSLAARAEIRDALDQRLPQWLVQAGFLPVAIPNSLLALNGANGTPDSVMLDYWLQVFKPGALILSGGNDIGEFPSRDATENYILSWAEVHRVPLLGICRGMQMMAVWAGSELVKAEGHVRSRHQLVLQDLPKEWPASVNSYHNWKVSTCPEQFEVAARAEDGAIEAIRHAHLPWEGWMWHPEREHLFNQQDTMRIKRLFGER
jgi:N5-(cytidine 5'-diphosphoramidyl)-L-glutamine hydrolase